jgi:hypothetical protein
VRLIESLMGRINYSSYLPQYFTSAMFGDVVTVDRNSNIKYHCYC